MPIFFCFFISILAEMNRSPMDLVEGESGLVSGFNVEYYGVEFALIFIAEYGRIIFFCLITGDISRTLFVLSSKTRRVLSISLGIHFYVRHQTCLESLIREIQRYIYSEACGQMFSVLPPRLRRIPNLSNYLHA